MKTSELLRRARERLVRFGWVQGRYGYSSVGHCAIGALYGDRLRVPDGTDVFAGEGFLEDAIGAPGTVVAWNDKPGRTAAEVLAAYDDAIAIAESAEWTDRRWKDTP